MSASPDRWPDLRATVALLAVSSGWHVADVGVGAQEVQLTLTDPHGAPMGEWHGSMDALRSLAGSLQRQAVHTCRLLEAVDELDRLLTPDPCWPPVLGESAATVARGAVTELGGGPHWQGVKGEDSNDDRTDRGATGAGQVRPPHLDHGGAVPATAGAVGGQPERGVPLSASTDNILASLIDAYAYRVRSYALLPTVAASDAIDTARDALLSHIATAYVRRDLIIGVFSIEESPGPPIVAGPLSRVPVTIRRTRDDTDDR